MPFTEESLQRSTRPPEEKKGVLKRIWEDMLPIEEHIGAGIMYNKRLDPSMGFIKAALKGIKENTTYADVLEEAGMESKAGRLLGGMGLSIALSPSTYLSFGATAAGKLAIKGGVPLLTKAAPLLTTGLKAPTVKGALMAGEKIPVAGKLFEAIGRGFSYGYDRSKLPEFADAIEDILTKEGVDKEKAIELVNRLKYREPAGAFKKPKVYTEQEQKDFGRMWRGEIPITREVENLIKPIQDEFDRLGYEATQVKGYKGKPLLDIKVYEKNKGRYLPTLYRAFEDKNFGGATAEFMADWSARKHGIPIEPWMAKKTDQEFGAMVFDKIMKKQFSDYLASLGEVTTADKKFNMKSRFHNWLKQQGIIVSAEDLVKMGKKYKEEILGEIKEPAYSVGKRLIQEADAVENAKLFNFIYNKYASLAPLEGYQKMPDSPKWGMIADKYVPEIIFNELNKLKDRKSDLTSLWDKGINIWKIGKTIANPGYHSRNLISSFIQKDAGGYNILEQIARLPGTFKEWKLGNKSEEFLSAKQSGIFKGTYNRIELDKLLDVEGKGKLEIYDWAKYLGGLGPIGQYGAKLQDFVEDIQRFDMWRYLRQQGKNATEAADLTGKYLVDYKKITEFEQKYLKRIFPFYTFVRKTAPVFLETAITSPGTIAKYPKMFGNIEQLSKEEEEKERFMPDWLKNRVQVRIPIKDEKGNSLYYNVSYTLPYGDLLDFSQPFKKSWLMFNPIMKEGAEQMLNKDAYFEKEITNKYLPQQTQINERLIHAFRTFGANLLPGGYSWNKTQKAILQQPDYGGRISEIPTTVLDVLLGIKLTPFDVEQGQQSQYYKLKDEVAIIKERMRRVVKDQSISEKKKEKLIKMLEERLQETRQ